MQPSGVSADSVTHTHTRAHLWYTPAQKEWLLPETAHGIPSRAHCYLAACQRESSASSVAVFWCAFAWRRQATSFLWWAPGNLPEGYVVRGEKSDNGVYRPMIYRRYLAPSRGALRRLILSSTSSYSAAAAVAARHVYLPHEHCPEPRPLFSAGDDPHIIGIYGACAYTYINATTRDLCARSQRGVRGR